MSLRKTALTLALSCLCTASQAWTYTAIDDGTFLVGQAASEDRFIAIGCVGISEQYDGEIDTEWSLTSSGRVSVRISRYILPATDPTRSDVVIVVDGVPIALPIMYENTDSQGYETTLRLDHPVLVSLREGTQAVVEAGGTPVAPISLAFAEVAIATMVNQCHRVRRP